MDIVIKYFFVWQLTTWLVRLEKRQCRRHLKGVMAQEKSAMSKRYKVIINENVFILRMADPVARQDYSYSHYN